MLCSSFSTRHSNAWLVPAILVLDTKYCTKYKALQYGTTQYYTEYLGTCLIVYSEHEHST